MTEHNPSAPEIELKIPAPGYWIPESMLFGHSTRLLDMWAPEPERIVKPAMEVGAAEIAIRVFKGNTIEFGTQGRTRNPAKMLRRRQTLSMPDKYIYDSRHDTDANIAHQIDIHASRVLLARQKLKAVLDRDVEIHLIVRSGAAGSRWSCIVYLESRSSQRMLAWRAGLSTFFVRESIPRSRAELFIEAVPARPIRYYPRSSTVIRTALELAEHPRKFMSPGGALEPLPTRRR